MPEHILNNLAAYVGCISGAIQIDEYRKLLIDAGFKGWSKIAQGALAAS